MPTWMLFHSLFQHKNFRYILNSLKATKRLATILGERCLVILARSKMLPMASPTATRMMISIAKDATIESVKLINQPSSTTWNQARRPAFHFTNFDGAILWILLLSLTVLIGHPSTTGMISWKLTRNWIQVSKLWTTKIGKTSRTCWFHCVEVPLLDPTVYPMIFFRLQIHWNCLAMWRVQKSWVQTQPAGYPLVETFQRKFNFWRKNFKKNMVYSLINYNNIRFSAVFVSVMIPVALKNSLKNFFTAEKQFDLFTDSVSTISWNPFCWPKKGIYFLRY